MNEFVIEMNDYIRDNGNGIPVRVDYCYNNGLTVFMDNTIYSDHLSERECEQTVYTLVEGYNI